MNLSQYGAEVVGADLTAVNPTQAPVATTAPASTTSTASAAPGVISAIGQGLGSIIGASKWGKKAPATYVQGSSTPSWLLPAGVGLGALLLITVVAGKKK